ncbi:MAG: hypothetical protein IPP13_10500 [Kouleothrix sp.]|jgi:hypothetical protein|nr:hypothetical protein [Kouleothrix sp.]
MSQEQAEMYRMKRANRSISAGGSGSLKMLLWLVWVAVVAGTAAWNWYLDVAADQPVNLLGIVVYTILAGVIGLLVITLVEQRLDPERFVA